MAGVQAESACNVNVCVSFDATRGKANFDISEWMLLEVLRCFYRRRSIAAAAFRSPSLTE
ncbi:hypothetical protein HF289_12820 [Acidithiobacillus ferrooxidans]|jgi:hypothetical protein|uniref:hypothetical protein n=1 Tax=Acidithiobacillus ferrooxidans TaxID=920 RepID=UPI001C06C222|nr:hypothetical protein [Acidithiobacillus ferrooxidans]MBU2857719.1 hypothetical protein [Acidithiobacillus ferrooxidans]